LHTLTVERERTTAAARGCASVDECRLIPLRTVDDPRGSITIVEAEQDVPFAIERVYHLHGVPAGGSRGGHAHRRLEQILIAVAGAFDVVLDDCAARRRVRLDDPRTGLYIPPGIWREMESFTDGTVCLVLASMPYDEADYERDYEDFRARRGP
jgi:dTDP-4-dehydrorhamnose 3,5-epimerase-like enzyme